MKVGSIILTPKQNDTSIILHHAASPKNEEARTIPSAGIIMETIFWDAKGCTLVDFLPKGTYQCSSLYSETVTHPMKRRIILHHNNASPYIAHLTSKRTEKI
jgi:hypothetical protein